ncbi:AhpC/TSA family protein [Acidipila sp. EB88]|uniref:AhpC/TSA family protein n=1 Tax=Acidipila sp. EB88 TaxID=2305226 RepID=UPI000F5F9F79|nr:AhpC/TSA family protein [Acidipila sp. EB88]RRA48279.1 AhpC/TSA family protein [Acidipila sp. EB88]
MKTAPKVAIRSGLPPGVLPPDPDLIRLFSETKTQSGKSLLDVADKQPILLVFLRHFGDSFTREAIHDISKAKPALDKRNVQVVFVHMADDARALPWFEKYGLGSAERVHDPEMKLYTAPVFHLLKSTVLPHFFGARAYWKLAKRALWKYGFAGPGKEDPTQLPGVFFIKDRAIYRAFRHKYLGDRPDYSLFGV